LNNLNNKCTITIIFGMVCSTHTHALSCFANWRPTAADHPTLQRGAASACRRYAHGIYIGLHTVAWLPRSCTDGVQIWTVCRPEIRTDEVQCRPLQQLDGVAGAMCRSAVLLNECWKHLLRQQDIAVILAVYLHPGSTNINSVIHIFDTASRQRTLYPICWMLSACVPDGWDRCVASWFRLAHKPGRSASWMVVRPFDGKHFFNRKPYELDCRITKLYLFDSCLQQVRIGFRQLLRTTSFDTLKLEIAMNYSVHSQSVNASFTWDITNRSVRFCIVFLTEEKVFDILSVLVDTHRTRSAAKCCHSIVPVLRIFFNSVHTSTF